MGRFSRFFNITSFVFLAIFTPLTILILFSQNAVPGDLFYPVKRGLEGGVLVAASVNPTTRAMFTSNLADRRFTEAERVIIRRGDTSGLSEFVFTVSQAAQEINSVEDASSKAELRQNFTASLDNYERKIAEIKTQVVYIQTPVVVTQQAVTEREIVREVVVTPTSPSTGSLPTPTPISLPTNTPVPQPTAKPGRPALPTNTPVPLPTATPVPTLTPTPIPTPTPTPQVAQAPTRSSGTEELDDVAKWVKCVREHPGNENVCPIPSSVQSSQRGAQGEERRDQRKTREREDEEKSRQHKEREEKEREKRKGGDEQVQGASTSNENGFIQAIHWLMTPSIQSPIE